ncbi:hypothetical protein Dxin01_00104 [Deinococcus xinjiangensis]|uniref:Helix-turn-helix domain-containing protein n=1 Tax=Deinococcus xinjiangensis TaxID=457454 RepID=A0ABP9V516_9DEIO
MTTTLFTLIGVVLLCWLVFGIAFYISLARLHRLAGQHAERLLTLESKQHDLEIDLVTRTLDLQRRLAVEGMMPEHYPVSGVQGIADHFKISKNLAYEQIRLGNIPAFKVKGVYVLTREGVDQAELNLKAYFNLHEAQSQPAAA